MYVVRVPGINGLGKTKGCGLAGAKILETLKKIEVSEQGKLIDTKLLDLEEIHLDNSNVVYSNELIYKNAVKTFETKSKSIFLGGDHSISYSLARGFKDVCEKEDKEHCLIVFDAHLDLMEPVDKNIPTHEEWLRALIENGFKPENILLVGVRNMYRDEIIYMKQKGVRVIGVDKLEENLSYMCEIIMEFADGKELYVSIDIDVVDPSFAPGTGYRETGGLTSRQLIYLLHRIKKIKGLKAIDIVEINPLLDENEKTVEFGAKILAELI